MILMMFFSLYIKSVPVQNMPTSHSTVHFLRLSATCPPSVRPNRWMVVEIIQGHSERKTFPASVVRLVLCPFRPGRLFDPTDVLRTSRSADQLRTHHCTLLRDTPAKYGAKRRNVSQDVQKTDEHTLRQILLLHFETKWQQIPLRHHIHVCPNMAAISASLQWTLFIL